jgi:hypothetical protein
MKETLKKGTHTPGRHVVLPRNGLKVGQQVATRGAQEYETLTAARSAAKNGTAIVRVSDGLVVSVR